MKITEDKTVRVNLETGTDDTYLEWQNIDGCVYISVNSRGVFVDVQQIDEFIEGLKVLRKYLDKEIPGNG